MIVLVFLPVVLGLLLLAAHFLRGGDTALVAACLALAGLLAVRRPWAARVLQGVLVLGALEWIRTLVRLAGLRTEAGGDAGRLVIILGTVSAVTALAALLLETPRARGWFGRARPGVASAAPGDHPAGEPAEAPAAREGGT